jgi:hypothetical protein
MLEERYLKMTKYQSVKVTFDLDDEYQLKLYEHLKNRTNGSSYIRTLIHLDLIGKEPQINVASVFPAKEDEFVKEHKVNDERSESVVDIKSDIQSATVKQTTHHDIKLMINNSPIGFIEEDIPIDDLI